MEEKIHQPKKNRKRRVVGRWIVLIALAIVALALMMHGCTDFAKDAEPGSSAAGGSHDIPISGGLSVDESPPPQPDYFNIRINSTPTNENGRLNLRIENSRSNIYACQVSVVVQRYKNMSKSGEKLCIQKEGTFYEVLCFPGTMSYRLRPLEDATGYQETTFEDDSLLIYKSPIIAPDQSLENCTIAEPLPAGHYYAIARYTLYTSDGETAGQSNVALEINSKGGDHA